MKVMTADRPWTGRTILTALLVSFGVIFSVNGVFVYFALSTWPGFSQSDSYEKGLRYNDVIRAAKAQKDLGWRSDVTLAGNGIVHVRIVGPDGRPVDSHDASVTIERPLGDVAARTIELSMGEDGMLSARSAPLPAGIWHVTVTAKGPGEVDYRMQHVVAIRP